MALPISFWAGLRHIYNDDRNTFAMVTPVPMPQYYYAGSVLPEESVLKPILPVSFDWLRRVVYARILMPMTRRYVGSGLVSVFEAVSNYVSMYSAH